MNPTVLSLSAIEESEDERSARPEMDEAKDERVSAVSESRMMSLKGSWCGVGGSAEDSLEARVGSR